MFAQIDYVVPPASAGQNGLFMVESLPGASCQLWRKPVAVDNSIKRSQPFQINTDGWYYAAWGKTAWTIGNVTVTVYVVCTPALPDTRPAAQSADVNVFWPPAATPSPPPVPSAS